MKKHAIFISADRKFFEILKICLSSIQRYYPQHPEIIVCHTDFLWSDQQMLQETCTNIIFISNTLSQNEIWPIMSHLTDVDPRVFYARFMLWKEKIFTPYDTILHLDADILVLQDLSALFEEDEFFMVQEAYKWNDQIFKNFDDFDLKQKLYENNISVKNIAGNAGVFLLPKKCRTQKHYQELMNILFVYQNDIKWADQSVINIWAYKYNFKLSENYDYNFQHRILIDGNMTMDQIKIVHFNGIDAKYRISCMQYFLYLYENDCSVVKYRDFYNELIQYG